MAKLEAGSTALQEQIEAVDEKIEECGRMRKEEQLRAQRLVAESNQIELSTSKLKEEGKQLFQTKDRLSRNSIGMEGTITNMLAYRDEVEQCVKKSETEIARRQHLQEERQRRDARS